MNNTLKKILIITVLLSFTLFSHTFSRSNVINNNYDEMPYVSRMQSKLTEMIKNAKESDVIEFGHYEQDNNIDNGKEPVEWIILDKTVLKNERYATLISKYILDCGRFHATHQYATWETSTIRKYLNEDLINVLFEYDELVCVKPVVCVNDKNFYFGTPSGFDTIDYIYLPSITDMYKYFTDDTKSVQERYGELLKKNIGRQAIATEYAKARGVRAFSKKSNFPGAANYFLRTTGLNGHRIWYRDVYADFYQTYITELGELRPDGTGIDSNDDGLRLMINVYY